MKKITSLYGLIFLALLIFSGCKDFIEPSIQDKKVVLLAPANGTESMIYGQNFWWEEVEDALKYRLQVVSPTFNNAARMVLDTVVTLNKFSFTLDPGSYEWRVRAENGSSQTAYTTAAFVIYSTALTEQQPQLQSPANNLVTNVSSATFKWLKLYGATSYQLQVDTNNFADETILFVDQNTPNTEFPATFIRNKQYQWRVKGVNATESSKWSAVQNVTFDNIPPAKTVLAAPAAGAAVSSPVTLSWTPVSTATKYQLYVYQGNQATPYNTTFPLTLTGTSYSFTGNLGEQVYWQVRAIDAVGNQGPLSDMRNFSIQ